MRKGANFNLGDVPDSIERETLNFVAEDGGLSRGVIYRPRGVRPRVGVHVMHPKTDQTQNYNILPLVEAGYAVLGRAGRWVNNDIGTIHEHLLLDMAAGVRWLRESGCEAVVLLGNSGGGGLASLYQAQAGKAPPERWTTTAAGEAFDLNRYDLPSADGVVMVASHLGEGYCLAKWLDPSVIDEDPGAVDPELDMYNFDNGFRLPPEPSRYTAAFLERWHAARLQRVQRIEAMARERVLARQRALAEAADAKDPRVRQQAQRRAAVVNHIPLFRAAADPAWLDPTIESDDRDICAFNNDPRPDITNFGSFLSAFVTPEAYLSTWSSISGRARTGDRLREFTAPFLFVHYGGDSASSPREAQLLFDGAASPDKTLVTIPKCDHYGFRIIGPHQRGERSPDAGAAVVAWMQQRFPLARRGGAASADARA